ncbi:MAG TPA: hypothetical protein VFU74_01900 [Actinocrinis sp.]|nr:hypothetical protein [Actinocrinis sp.]
MNAAEDRLSQLMDAATCALDPPIEALLAGGERLGRARRRRRRMAVGAGTTAVVLFAGVGVAAGLRSTGPGGSYGAAGHTTARPSLSAGPLPASPEPTPSATLASSFPTPRGPRPGEVPINATAAVNILRQLVAKTWKFGSYLPSTPGSLLRVDVDDGNGIAQITVNVAAAANSGMDPADCAKQGLGTANESASPTSPPWTGGASPSGSAQAPPGSVAPNGSECFITQVDNGDTAMTEVLASPPSKVVIDRVIAYRADGIAVEITARNGDLKSIGGGVTRVRPPLDAMKWTYIALNPIWQLFVPAALVR